MKSVIAITGMYGAFAQAIHGRGKSERILGYYDPEKKLNINRNDPCHCGSGVKYKKCCLNK